MKEPQTPTATRQRATANGVRLRIESWPRVLRSSARWDARVTGHDFETIYSAIHLDAPAELTIVDSFSLDEQDEDYHATQELTAILDALGAPDDFAAIWADILETRAEIQSKQKGA